MTKTLALVREFRDGDDATPIVLMGYYNPIYIYGVDRFLADAKAAGVDGLIVVDLPPEEDDELCLPALKAGLNFIRLATPTTDDKRLPAVLATPRASSTTSRSPASPARRRPTPARSAPRSRASSATPSCRSRSASACGRAEQARAIAAGADGVVVGSALVDALRASLDESGKAGPDTVKAVTDRWCPRWPTACARRGAWRPRLPQQRL